jgi:predicted amidohydrolase
MSKKDLNIVLLQSDIFWEDIAKNLAHFSGLVKEIREPVDLVILPEMFSTGFTTNIVKCAETMDGPSMHFLPLVCYDLRFPVWSKNTYLNGKYEYDVLVYPSNWPRSRAHVWKSLLIARAIENQAYVIGANRIGADGYGTRHAGNSMVVDPKGNILAEASDKEKILQATLSMEELILFRESFKIGLDWDRFIIET